jgi:signal transduction histidine kinase
VRDAPFEPKLADAIDKASRVALTSAGAAIFIPALVLLLLGFDTRGLPDWLALLIPTTVWCAGLLPALHRQRAPIQTLAGVLLLLSPLLIAPWGSPGWVMLTTVAFATIVGIVFSFDAIVATVLVAFVAGLNAYVAVRSPPAVAFPGDDLMGNFMGPLMDLVCGIGLVIAHSEWVRLTRVADELHAELLGLEETSRRESATAIAQATVERRIHETVLNTLAGISMTLDASSAETARESCIRDLEQLAIGAQPAPRAHLEDIIASAMSATAADEVDCTIHIDVDAVIDPVRATALRDALVEALRNVKRHAGTSNASITVTGEGTSLIVRVHDNGLGLVPAAAERFGMRNTIRSGMAAVGGSATIGSGDGAGTTVTLTIPAGERQASRVPHVPALGLLDESLLSRVGLLGTNVFVLMAAPFISGALTPRAPVFLAIVLFVSINTALALLWNTAARKPLALAGLAAAAIAFAAAGATAPGCSVVSSLVWLVTGVSGGGVLLIMLAFDSTVARILVPVYMTAIGLALALSLPDTCQIDPLATLVIQLSYLGAVLYFIVWVDDAYEAQHDQAREVWQRIVEESAARDAQSALDSAWSHLSDSALELITGIADGSQDPNDAAIRSLAASEASALRRRLGLRTSRLGPMDHLLDRLALATEGTGSTIDAEAITETNRSDPLPEEVCLLLERIVGATWQAAIGLTCFEDDGEEEYLLIVPHSALDAAEVDSTEIRIADCTVAVLADEIGADDARISIRRPSHSAASSPRG